MFTGVDPSEPLRLLAGWTMVHVLWIGAVIALTGAAVRLACRHRSPALRYTISLTTLAVLASSPAAIALWLHAHSPAIFAGSPTSTNHAADSAALGPMASAPHKAPTTVMDLAHITPPLSPGGNEAPARQEVVSSGPPPAGSLIDPRARWIAHAVVRQLPWVWLCGAPLTFALLAAGLVGSERLRRASTPLTAGPAAELCQRLRVALHISRRVSLAACDRLAQPVLVGIFRPLILLPASALSGWTADELEMILLHELAHVRRWDNLVNLLQRIIESLLFFHPAVWLFSRQVRRDREECCDAAVVTHTGRAQAYASLLASIAASLRGGQNATIALASGIAGHPLVGRIRRILRLEDEPMWISRQMLALTLVLPLLLIGVMVFTAAAAVEQSSTPSRGAASGGVETDGARNDQRGDQAKPQTATDEYGSPLQADKQEAEDQQPIIITYRTFDHDHVNLQKWIQIAGSDKRVKLQWFDKNKSIVISAPASVHKQIAELLEQARVSKGVQPDRVGTPREIALTQLQSEIQFLEGQIVQTKKELVDLEVFKQTALQNARSPAALDAAVQAELSKNPTMRTYEEQLSTLQIQRQKRMASGDDENDATLKRLDAAIQQSEADAKRYRAETEKTARERLAHTPNEAIRAALTEYTIRHEALTVRLKELEQKLQKARQRFAGFAPAPPAASSLQPGDAVEASADSEPLLAPGDVVVIQVVGASPEQSIDDAYAIEPRGTIALGPTYGRVHVAGKTILEAEAAIEGHLETILTDAEVQLTRPAADGQAKSTSKYSDHGAAYLYDGKTFEQWRDLWKTELKTEKRMEAIAALAAFARAGYGKQAAEALFDVAGQYDFFTIDQSAEGQLKQQVISLLTERNSPHVHATDWLTVLLERLVQDPQKWKWLAWHLLAGLQTTDADVKSLLEKFEKLEDPAIKKAAKAAGQWVPDIVRTFLALDQNGDGLTAQEAPDVDWPIIETADANNDGAVTEAELIESAAEIEARLQQRQMGRGGGFFSVLDEL
jgi:beta-lactamase regulating signal transducer with metallopeptidase domain